MRLLKMYWSANMTIKQIIMYIKNENILKDFKDINIACDKDFYTYINKVCKNFDIDLKKNKTDFYNNYELNASKLKHSLKIIIKNFAL